MHSGSRKTRNTTRRPPVPRQRVLPRMETPMHGTGLPRIFSRERCQEQALGAWLRAQCVFFSVVSDLFSPLNGSGGRPASGSGTAKGDAKTLETAVRGRAPAAFAIMSSGGGRAFICTGEAAQ